MNIKSLINPLIFDRCGIDDNLWSIRLSVVNSLHGSKARIKCQNKYNLNTVMGKKKESDFSLMLLIDESGEIEFNRITIAKGVINCQKHRDMIKGELYELFKELRAKN